MRPKTQKNLALELNKLGTENKLDTEWKLESGTWYEDSKNGYLLKDFQGGDTAKSIELFKQLYSHSTLNGKIFPPEFDYDPQTGEPLTRTQGFSANDVWIAPYGQSVFVDNQNRHDHGLQYTRQVKTLKNNKRKTDDPAEIEITHPFSGSMEFFSICVGTDIPQLIALNTSQDDQIFLLLKDTIKQKYEWIPLKHTGKGLLKSPDQWRKYWGVEAFYRKNTQQHFLLLPTSRGLAELSINGMSLQYTVDYHGSGECLGKPIYWNNCIYIPIDNAGKVQIWNYTQRKVELTTKIDKQYFKRVAFESQTALIWLSDHGQLILNKDVVEGHISDQFIPWLPELKPDFKYGSPYFNGDLYQLCWHQKEEKYFYVHLNSPNNNVKPQPCTSARFTTGSMAYSLEGRISDRRDNKGRKIWESLNQIHEQNNDLFVPLMEDQDLKKDLALGIVFKIGGDQSIADIFSQQSEKQNIIFRLNTINGKEDFLFSNGFSDPIRKSRFFYHHNYLYFYHQDKHDLKGWEVQA